MSTRGSETLRANARPHGAGSSGGLRPRARRGLRAALGPTGTEAGVWLFYMDDIAKRAGCNPHTIAQRRGIDLPVGRWVTHPRRGWVFTADEVAEPLPRSSAGLGCRDAGATRALRHLRRAGREHVGALVPAILERLGAERTTRASKDPQRGRGPCLPRARRAISSAKIWSIAPSTLGFVAARPER
jgi:hypothetical protein